MIFSKIFGKNETLESAHSLYTVVVEQARQPVFYTNYQVADTVDGRFDLIALHAYLLLYRLKEDSDKTADLSQAVFDVMFDNFDENLREMGVGDIGISTRIKKMVSAFYGRVSVYDEGLADIDDKMLMQALRRNLYKKVAVDDSCLEAMAKYMRRQTQLLSDQKTDVLLSGSLSFGGMP